MINKFDVLHNFISPVTGRILATTNYVLVGNDAGIAVPTPDIIDIKLNIIDIRTDLVELTSASFVIGSSNIKLPQAQVLNVLEDGLLYNTNGVVSIVEVNPNFFNLQYGNIWVGDFNNNPTETSNFITGPALPVSVDDVVALWNGISGREIKVSSFTIQELEALADEADAAAASAAASASSASSAAAVAVSAAASAAASANIALFGARRGKKGRRGDRGEDGKKGAAGTNGSNGEPGLSGPAGAAGASGKETTVVVSNVNFTGGRIENLSPSPQGDYDAVTAKWVWDLLNDNVVIKWE